MKCQIDNALVSSHLEDGYVLPRYCIDSRFCHHQCGAGCFRQECCFPLGEASHYLDENWNRVEIKIVANES